MAKNLIVQRIPLYIGGGTPGIIGADRLSSIAKTAKFAFMIDDNAEITAELNPARLMKALIFKA